MVVNLHTHTYRCHHASGTEEEYIQNAISGGIKVMGFSDHLPHINEDGSQDGYRIWTDDAKDYIATVNALKEKYKDTIELHVGFECEYYKKYFPEMLARAQKLGAEYLILGQHFIYDGARYAGDGQNGKPELEEYISCIEEAAKTGKFTYLCHPDVFYANLDDGEIKAGYEKICQICNKYSLPVEINMLGIRDHRRYPDPRFWEIAGKYGCETVFGFDAHDAPAAYDSASIAVAEQIVKDFGLNLNEHPKIVQI
ncbi:MAG: histidinol-phosphatase [Oscillospiraceae bacterium]|nr:histidinol-phosphatase [Candidatus Equicaccousia limihippi]